MLVSATGHHEPRPRVLVPGPTWTVAFKGKGDGSILSPFTMRKRIAASGDAISAPTKSTTRGTVPSFPRYLAAFAPRMRASAKADGFLI